MYQRKRPIASTSTSLAPKRQRTGRTRRSNVYGRSSLTEVKSFDQEVAQFNCVAVAALAGQEPGAMTSLTCINEVRQGATFYNRVGSKVVNKSVSAGFQVTASAGTVQACVRALLIYDRQPNGAFPASTDLFQDNAGGQTFNSGLNITNKSRFKIIRDKFFMIDLAQSLVHDVRLYAKGRWETEYKGDAGTIADLATGALYLVVFKSTQVGVGNITVNDVVTRVRYFD